MPNEPLDYDETAPTLPLAEPHDPSTFPVSFGDDRYKVIKLLGQGGQKQAYLAHDSQLDRQVVIALLKNRGLDTAHLSQIRREARTMGRLGDHPYIVTVYDIGDEEGQPYIVSQYVGGGSLKDLLQKAEYNQLPFDQILRFSSQVCQALDYVHKRGVIHRDVKPNNIWLTKNGTAKLGDFGLAINLKTSLTGDVEEAAGTIAYISPEQAMGDQPEPRSDLYSLGVMLYEMSTGRLPFQGDLVSIVSQHLHVPPVAPSWHNPNIPKAFETLILHLLAKTPDERPESADVVLRALEKVSSSEPSLEEDSKEPRSLDRLAAGVFVGRVQEMGELKKSLRETISGHGRVVLLVGEAGSGKTRIMEQFGTYAHLHNVRVLFGRCYEGEEAPAFWPWVEILRSFVKEQNAERLTSLMGSGAADIAQLIPEVSEKLPHLTPPPALEPEQARFRLFNSVSSFLKNVSRAHPLVVFLDDIHWADKATLLLLQFLLREIKDTHLLVVCTHRHIEPQSQHPLSQTLGELARHGLGQRIVLSGLTESDVTRFVEMTSGLNPPEHLVKAVYNKTEGNPFFVNEVVRLLVAEGKLEGQEQATSWSITTPEGVREVVHRRLEYVSKECHQVLTMATIIGREFGLQTLEPLCEFSFDQTLEILEEGVAARIIMEVPGVVGQYKFCHALVREALYEVISTARRVRLHSRIGAMLEDLYSKNPTPHLAEIAYHFCQAAPIGNAGKAVDYAVKAAEQATRSLAFEEAVNHYETALEAFKFRESANEKDQCDLLLALGMAQRRADMPVQARKNLLLSADLTRKLHLPEQMAHAALGLEVRFTGANPEQVDQVQIDLVKEALEALGEGDSALRVRLFAQLSSALYYLSSEEAEMFSNQALEMAKRIDNAPALLTSLYNRSFALEGFERAEERLEIAYQIIHVAGEVGDKEMSLKGHSRCLRELMELGDIQGVEREIQAYAQLAGELRQPTYLWHTPFCKASLALVRGQFEESERLAAEAVALGNKAKDPNVKPFFGVLKYSQMKVQGRLQEIEQAVKAQVEKYPLVVGWQSMLAGLYAEIGKLEEARTVVEQIVANDLKTLPRDGSFTPVLAGLSNAFFFLDDVDNARKLYDLLLPYEGHAIIAGRCPVFGGLASRLLGLMASTMRRWDTAAEHFQSAIEMSAKMGAKPWQAITQRDYAQMILNHGRPDNRPQAVMLLEQAQEIYQQLGMRQMEKQVQQMSTESL